MKLYNVYMVRADDPVDARNVAVQRLIVDVKGVPQA